MPLELNATHKRIRSLLLRAYAPMTAREIKARCAQSVEEISECLADLVAEGVVLHEHAGDVDCYLHPGTQKIYDGRVQAEGGE